MANVSTPSFVADVIATSGNLVKEDIRSSLAKLSRHISEAKNDVNNALQAKYVDFMSQMDTSVELTTRVQSLSEDIAELEAKIEGQTKGQLDFSVAEFDTLSAQMNKSRLIVSILKKMMTLHTGFKAIKSMIAERDYKAAYDELLTLNACMNEAVHEREGEVILMKRLLEQCLQCDQMLEHSVSQEWSNCVKWKIPSPSDTSKEVICELTFNAKDSKTLTDAITVMNHLEVLKPKMALLANRFFTCFVQPIVTNPCKVEVNSRASEVLVISYNRKDENSNSAEEVFSNFMTAMDFINDRLLKLTIGEEILMSMFSAQINEKSMEVFVNYLMKSVPTSQSNLERYSTVLQRIEAFEDYLSSIKFIDSNNALKAFVNDISSISADKRTQEVLEKARSLMMTNVHNTIKISSEGMSNAPLAELEGSSVKKSKSATNNAIKLSAKTFHLPDCLISECVSEVRHLCYETCNEACKTNPEAALQLVYAVRLVFELFCNVFASKKDTALPQQSAIQHNDCMYMAHHALFLGPQMSAQMPFASKSLVTFLDFAPKLRRLGAQCFMDQMMQQKKNLVELLAATQGFMGVGEDANRVSSTQAVNQVMHQVQHLSNVWFNVLPSSIYNKSIGGILNTVINEAVKSIVALDDISKDDSTQLHILLKLIATKSIKAFDQAAKAENTVAEALLLKHVTKWNMLKELEILMDASLVDISDRWAEGKGPLAAEFKAHEVKRLIRALFQNTDRRADFIAKIH